MNENFKKKIEAIAIPLIVALLIYIIPTYFSELVKSVHAVLLDYPFIFGVIISCIIAFLSILVILMFANDNNIDKYFHVFIKYEKVLLYLTMSILFYIAIHLASLTFYKTGIPFVSEPYDRADIFRYVSPQDIFLTLLALSVIFLIFIIAPRISNLQGPSIHIVLPKLKLELKDGLLCFPWIKIKVGLSKFFFIAIIFLLIGISFIIIPSLPEFTDKSNFNWDEIPGNDSKTLEDILRWDYNISWIDTAEIEKIDCNKAIKVSNKNNSLFLRLNDQNTNATLKINDRIAGKFFANEIDGELKIYSQTIEHKPNKSWFRNFFILSLIILISIFYMYKKNFINIRDDIKKIKNDFNNLIIYYCTIPAIFVASLVLSGNNLIKYIEQLESYKNNIPWYFKKS